MQCPVCRCISPKSMRYCSYCGYRFEMKDEESSVYEFPYSQDLTKTQFSYGYSGELTFNADKSAYNHVNYPAYSDDSRLDTINILLLGVCLAALVILLGLLLLLL